MANGFKDSTKTHYSKGGPAGGPKGAAKISSVMRAYKTGGAVKAPAPTLRDLEQSNRDVGGMDAGALRSAGQAVARGNRMQAEEAHESTLLDRARLRELSKKRY